MSYEPENDSDGQGRDGALAALREVAEDPEFVRLFSLAIASFDLEDYEQIISLAWRYQFDDDRTKFKRGMHELQQHVSQRILGRLELSE